MKKLFFILCALCLCGTMWGAVTDVNAYKDSDRPENSTNEIYVDLTTGLSFYVNSNNEAVITYVSDWTADGVTTSNSGWTSGYAINGTLTIPEQVSADGNTYYNVTKIGASAFVSDTTISGTLTIPATITTIGAAAFSYCTGIETVIFEESDVALVDECNTSYYSMFYNAVKVSKVEMYRNLSTSYSNSNVCAPFSYQSALAEVILGEKITSLPNYMFRSYYTTGALAKVTSYAENPPTLGTAVFDRHADGVTLYTPYDYVNNYRLDSDWYSVFGNEIHSLTGEDPDWPSDELAFKYEGLWYEPIYKEDGETETGNCVLIADQGGEVYTGKITIPETATNSETGTTYIVTRIDENAFANSSIEGEVVIPANILYMGVDAFLNCTGITTVTYEYSPTELWEECTTNNQGGYSFQGCNKITTVNIYRDITWQNTGYQSGPFVGLGTVEAINIGPRVTYIPSYMFRNSSATTATTAINCYAVEPPELGTGPFGVLSSSCVAYVPQGSEADYQSSSWTTQYSTLTIQEMDNAFAITTHENDEGTAYATFYNSAANVELFNGTLTAYEATTLEDEGLVIDIVEIGNVIPKATGVVVETAEAGTYLAIATENEDGSASTNNHLYGFDTATQCSQGDNYLYYLLSSYEGVVGFYWGATDGAAFTCQAHRAYLALEQGSGSQGISIRKGSGDDSTGISSIESAAEGATVKGIYTIQGVRVSNMNQPGLYIVDGRKVLVK